MIKFSGNFDIDNYLSRLLPQPWLSHIPQPISRFLGYRKDTPRKRRILSSISGLGLGRLAALPLLKQFFKEIPTLPTVGATAVLLYGAIEAPFAQPRAVFFGHTLSPITGVIVTKLFRTNEARFIELQWLAGAIACATAAVVMTTKTIHPPSGATAMIAATQVDITALGWYYIPVIMLSHTLAQIVLNDTS